MSESIDTLVKWGILNNKPKVYASLVIPGSHLTFLSLFHNKSQSWRFGGGKLEDGELPLAAAVREAQEEFGIEVTAARLLQVVTHFVDGADWTGHWFLVEKFNGVLKLNEPHKHSKAAWLSLCDLADRNCHPEYEVAKSYHEGKT